MNSELQQEKAEVLALIDAAFGHIEYPGIEYISIPDSYEGQLAATAFSQLHWRKFTLGFLLPEYQSSLSFFTAKGYEYYLPGYMRIGVMHLYDADTVLENTVLSLTPPDEAMLGEVATLLDNPELTRMMHEAGLPPLPMTGDDVRSTAKEDFEAAKRWFLSHPATLNISQKHAVLAFVELLYHNGYFKSSDAAYSRITDYYRTGKLPWAQ